MENLISVDDAAKFLGVTGQTVLNWIKDGRITALYPGGKGGHAKIDKTTLVDFYRPKEGKG